MCVCVCTVCVCTGFSSSSPPPSRPQFRAIIYKSVCMCERDGECVPRRLFALRLVGRLRYFGAVQLVRRFYSFQKSLLSLSFSFSFFFSLFSSLLHCMFSLSLLFSRDGSEHPPLRRHFTSFGRRSLLLRHFSRC